MTTPGADIWFRIVSFDPTTGDDLPNFIIAANDSEIRFRSFILSANARSILSAISSLIADTTTSLLLACLQHCCSQCQIGVGSNNFS